MKRLIIVERLCLIGHILAMAFGLAGIVLVLPHPEFIVTLPIAGQRLFQWSMSGGGVVYIVLGAVTVSLYAARTLGVRGWLTFFIPSVLLSLASELLGTSTGFPFGHYSYLSGLGYKIAGLVPFTIPLSWFYVGFVCYGLAQAGLAERLRSPLQQRLGAIALGALLLTAWDLVLDPAMSQAPFPFWEFQDVGEFFGMPYRNLTGWLGTGVVFMAVAAVLSQQSPRVLTRRQLTIPLVVYWVNFMFGAVITLTQLDSRFWIPTTLGFCLGVLPALALWRLSHTEPTIHPLSAAGEPSVVVQDSVPTPVAALDAVPLGAIPNEP
jgi:putative membrane protein